MVTLGLEDRIILVTSGNKGIGAAIVTLLADLGARVVFTHDGATQTQTTTNPLAIPADVRDYDTMVDVTKHIESNVGPIYGVVANTELTKDNLFMHSNRAEWDAVIDANLTGVYNTVRPALPAMTARAQGSIVLMSSIVGEQGNIGQANYAASKAGLIGLAKTVAMEGARHNVRINVIAPGFIETSTLQTSPEEIRNQLIQSIPLGRFGTPEEIAWATAWLLSPRSSYITGETLSVNGGRYM